MTGTITVTPLTPTLGAEVAGLDLLNLSDNDFVVLFEAFTNHSVVFLRDQPALTEQQHYDFASRFGPVHVHPFSRESPASLDKPFPGLLRMHTTEDTRAASGNRWHSDVSCDEMPPQASILQLHEIPELGGDTLFSSLYAAYETLSPQMKRYLNRMTAHHSGEESYRKIFERTTAPGATWPQADHPVVRRHPDSGRPALYVDREFTESINDLPKEEGRALLDFLLAHTERVNFQCRFQWTVDAIAIWDNRCVLHHAMWDYWPQERRGHRVSVQGEKPEMWDLDTDQIPDRSASNTVRLTR